jgi:hypothetical protein
MPLKKVESVCRPNTRVMKRKYYITRISGPYGPLILALAEGWLASLTRGFATLNQWRGLRPSPSLPLIVSASIFLLASSMN